MWKKLALKSSSLCVYNAPSSFNGALREIEGTHKVDTKLAAGLHEFILAFVKNKIEFDNALLRIKESIVEGDVILWLAYPKKSSKLSEDLSRDAGFESMGQLGFEPVASVSIDSDWSALRFRRVEYIKNLARHTQGAMTEAGKERTVGNKRTLEAASIVAKDKQGTKRGVSTGSGQAAKKVKAEAKTTTKAVRTK